MSELPCTCRLINTGFPPAYDDTACPTHGPDAPRYFVDHDTIHDRVTGQHVELVEAAGMLSVEPEAVQRIAWGAVVALGAKLKNAEAERDSLRTSLASARAELTAWSESKADVGRLLTNALNERDEALGELAQLTAERDEAVRELAVYREFSAKADQAEHEAFMRGRAVEREFHLHAIERDTAEAIAAFAEDEARMIDAGANPYAPTNDVQVARADALRELAADIRNHAWRKEGQ